MQQATQVCRDVLERGGTAVIVERATAYASEETWRALVKRHRRRGCDDLALLARRILQGKDQLHDAIGRAAGSLFGLLGRPRIERVFAQELARRIPLPGGGHLSAAARGLQITGIYLCVVHRRDLTGCACLRDVLFAEGEDHLHRLLRGGLEDWSGLPARVGDTVTG